MSVSFKDLQEAFEFVCAGGGGELPSPVRE